MVRSAALLLVVGIAAAFPTSMAATATVGHEILVESTSMPTRIVRTSIAELATDSGRASVERQLRSAARAVCNDHYRFETVYSYAHSCFAVTSRDAIDQLDRLIPSGRVATWADPDRQIEIAVRAR
jgi:UrcA family protein